MKAMLPSGTSPADHQTTLYGYGVGVVVGTDLFSEHLLAKVRLLKAVNSVTATQTGTGQLLGDVATPPDGWMEEAEESNAGQDEGPREVEPLPPPPSGEPVEVE